jgi:hypothetical protein
MRMRELERELELLTMQEEFLKDEQRHLKSEYIRSKEEVCQLPNLVNHFRSNAFNQYIWKHQILLRWSIRTTVSSALQTVDAMSVCYLLSTGKILSQMHKLQFIELQALLLTYYHPTLTQRFK